MFWVRIDNRLIHGMVIKAWLPHTGAKTLVVVNDDVAENEELQDILSLAIPSRIRVMFTKVEDLPCYLPTGKDLEKSFFLFANCRDARRAFEKGFVFPSINLGNIHYGQGRKQICDHVALSKEDEDCLDFLVQNGVLLDWRCVPKKNVRVRWP